MKPISSVSTCLPCTDSRTLRSAAQRKSQTLQKIISFLITAHMEIQLNVPLCLEAIVSQELEEIQPRLKMGQDHFQ